MGTRIGRDFRLLGIAQDRLSRDWQGVRKLVNIPWFQCLLGLRAGEDHDFPPLLYFGLHISCKLFGGAGDDFSSF